MADNAVEVEGAYDLHVHSSPDLFPRIADDAAMVADAARAGFAGVVMKNHFEGTASRAAIAARAVPGLRVYGGLVLNRYVGGVNPHAVEAALRLGARVIWMPTLDAACHRRAFGFGGGFLAQSSGLETQAPGLELLRDGRLIDEAREVMALVKEHGAALATGHVGFEEIAALVAEADAQGFRKLILTHPYDKAPGLTLDQVAALARPHVRIEFVFCSITPEWRFTDAATIAQCMKTIGPASFVISSDGGQAHNPMPAEGYRRFVAALRAEGVARDDFRVMCRENGDFLLNG
ncbi:MAG: hypothetical protein FJ027_03860 [Candidatus Rokubacteria bacterium]|nr:hypothetical protein [Candidatus Rokubacteria bacterium]